MISMGNIAQEIRIRDNIYIYLHIIVFVSIILMGSWPFQVFSVIKILLRPKKEKRKCSNQKKERKEKKRETSGYPNRCMKAN